MAEEKKDEKNEGEGEGAAKPKNKKKLFIIIGAVVGVLVIGGVTAVFLIKSKEAHEGEVVEEKEQEKHYETVELDTFIVNLSENASFLKVRLLLQYDPEILAKADGGHGGGEGGGHGGGGAGGGEAKEAGLPGVLATREPMIRDAIIRTLSSKRAEDVLSPDGKENLKEELIEAINEAIGLDEGAIVNIYFTEFLVQ